MVEIKVQYRFWWSFLSWSLHFKTSYMTYDILLRIKAWKKVWLIRNFVYEYQQKCALFLDINNRWLTSLKVMKFPTKNKIIKIRPLAAELLSFEHGTDISFTYVSVLFWFLITSINWIISKVFEYFLCLSKFENTFFFLFEIWTFLFVLLITDCCKTIKIV